MCFQLCILSTNNMWFWGGLQFMMGLYLHQMAHGVLDLLHGRSLTGFFVPAARHQRLYGLRKVFDQRRSCTCVTQQTEHHIEVSLVQQILLRISQHLSSVILFSEQAAKVVDGAGLGSPLWTAHIIQNAEPPISSKGFLRVMTSHRMMPQLNTSHFSL